MEQMLYERIQIMFRILSAFRRLNSFQIIVLGFAFVILLGAGILMLPVSSADGSWTPFVNALFTSVTSVCVTGLVVCDTGTYWSAFGHAVILLLSQLGGPLRSSPERRSVFPSGVSWQNRSLPLSSEELSA